ncbi:DUF3817 domain-containing protein [Mucilaginibacter hurinus]|uniref:DUF3817 domain-containing protein n=1 Tax=Mucilaginibacter hurinus TaxID=2201324 RepID=A0A367GU26_9SPHI|nr:DUF3817 domain-containing protein [Mucilaginibacter hurinus]RCH56203.1 DUF3817 domain-containing protein [Mucilaginibacter hurinus]
MNINMIKDPIGRLRLLGYLEGASLIILVFAGMPLKYWFDSPAVVKIVGPVHGVLFLWYVFNTISVAIAQNWKFTKITWKLLVASMVPFGTFYVDNSILSKLAPANK